MDPDFRRDDENLKQSKRAEAGNAAAREDQVIDQLDIEQPQQFGDSARGEAIARAWRWIAARVVMRENDSPRVAQAGLAQQIGRGDIDAIVEPVLFGNANQASVMLEMRDAKRFEALVSKVGTEHLRRIGGGAQARARHA